MRIFAGFDLGGSRSRCLLVSELGEIIGYGEGGPSNYLFIGKDEAKKSIQTAIHHAFGSRGEEPLAGVFIASAAVEVFEGESHVPFFREAIGCDTVECDSDIFPVWFAGTGFQSAICMISGTGAVTYLLRDRSFLKANGWGQRFGDEGSGFWLGRQAIKTVSRMVDQRIPKDEEFYNAVMAFYGVPDNKPRRLLPAVNRDDFASRCASLVPTIEKLYLSGNETAKKLYYRASRELLASVQAVLLQEKENNPDMGSFPLILSGGMLRKGSPLEKMITKEAALLTGVESVSCPDVSAVYAAAGIALERAGLYAASRRIMIMGEEG